MLAGAANPAGVKVADLPMVVALRGHRAGVFRFGSLVLDALPVIGHDGVAYPINDDVENPA
jgi:hypothetical protein